MALEYLSYLRRRRSDERRRNAFEMGARLLEVMDHSRWLRPRNEVQMSASMSARVGLHWSRAVANW